MRILIITDKFKPNRENNKDFFESDLIIKIGLDGTYDILRNRYGPNKFNLPYNHIYDTTPPNEQIIKK